MKQLNTTIIIYTVCICFSMLQSCRKADNTMSSDTSKVHIDTFLLKENDNGFLFATDSIAVLKDDSIIITLPGSDASNHYLIPTISFTGKGVSPRSGISQDFSNPVIYTVTDSAGTYRKYIAKVVYTPNNELVINSQRQFAMDLGTGLVRWVADDNNDVGISSAAATDGNKFYTGGGLGILYATSAVTGKLMWSQKISNSYLSSPAISGGLIYIGDGNGYFYAADTATGSVKWLKNLNPYGVFTLPYIQNNVVYIQCSNNFFALNATTGDSIWRSPVNASFSASAAIGTSAACVSGADSSLYSIDLASGQIQWSFPLGAGGSSPTLSNGVVYVATASDSLFAIDAVTGQKKWSVYVDTGPFNPYVSYPGIQSNPVIQNNTVYIGGGDENLYAFDAATGTLKWMSQLQGHVYAGIMYVDGVLYAACNDVICAVDAGTGHVKWTQTNFNCRLTPSIISAKGTIYNPTN